MDEKDNTSLAQRRGRGRPKGSKNKTKVPAARQTVDHQLKYIQKKQNECVAMGDDENAKVIGFLIGVHQIATLADRNNIDTLYDCLQKYLQLCIETGIRITNAAAYAACGVSRVDVCEWKSGAKRSNNPAYREFAEHLTSICSQSREILMAEGKTNPILGIWWQKSYDHMTDTPVEEAKHIDPLGDAMSAEDIAAKYGSSLDVDEEDEDAN